MEKFFGPNKKALSHELRLTQESLKLHERDIENATPRLHSLLEHVKKLLSEESSASIKVIASEMLAEIDSLFKILRVELKNDDNGEMSHQENEPVVVKQDK